MCKFHSGPRWCITFRITDSNNLCSLGSTMTATLVFSGEQVNTCPESLICAHWVCKKSSISCNTSCSFTLILGILTKHLLTLSRIDKTLYLFCNLDVSSKLLLLFPNKILSCSSTVKFFHVKLGSTISLYISNISL